MDGDGKKHKDPFNFMPGNMLAMELYDRIIELSPYQEINYAKGANKTPMTLSFPTLDAMDFVFKYFLPSNTTIDEADRLVQKISLIHQLKLSYRI